MSGELSDGKAQQASNNDDNNDDLAAFFPDLYVSSVHFRTSSLFLATVCSLLFSIVLCLLKSPVVHLSPWRSTTIFATR